MDIGVITRWKRLYKWPAILGRYVRSRAVLNQMLRCAGVRPLGLWPINLPIFDVDFAQNSQSIARDSGSCSDECKDHLIVTVIGRQLDQPFAGVAAIGVCSGCDDLRHTGRVELKDGSHEWRPLALGVRWFGWHWDTRIQQPNEKSERWRRTTMYKLENGVCPPPFAPLAGCAIHADYVAMYASSG